MGGVSVLHGEVIAVFRMLQKRKNEALVRRISEAVALLIPIFHMLRQSKL